MALPAPDPLRRYAEVQKASDAKLLQALEKASRDASRSISAATNGGKDMRATQLRLAKAAIQRRQAEMWREVGEITRAGRLDAAAAAAEGIAVRDMTALLSAGDVDAASALARTTLETARQGVRSLETRVSGASANDLSTRVYKNQALASGQIDTIINNALATGLTARELAAKVTQYISPTVPGGVSYAAMRLGRTEINNAFHETTKRLDANKPWVEGQQWNLSGSHPKPDECNTYADEDHDNLGAGVFRPDNVPSKPHPHCFCFITAVTPSIENFLKNMNSGQYDGYIAATKTPYEDEFARIDVQNGAQKAVRAGWNKTKASSPTWETMSHAERIASTARYMNKPVEYVEKHYNAWQGQVTDLVPKGKQAVEDLLGTQEAATEDWAAGLNATEAQAVEAYLKQGLREGLFEKIGVDSFADVLTAYNPAFKNIDKERLVQLFKAHPLGKNIVSKKEYARLGEVASTSDSITSVIVEKSKAFKVFGNEAAQDVQVAYYKMATKGLSKDILKNIDVEAITQEQMVDSNIGTVLAQTNLNSGLIQMGPKSFGPVADHKASYSYANGWWTKVPSDTSAGTYTFTHEMGHSLFEGIPFSRQSELLHIAEDAMNGAVGGGVYTRPIKYKLGELGTTDSSFARYRQEEWLVKNRPQLEKNVSQYGATTENKHISGAHELAAEMWAEYVLSPTPRPAAQAFGEALVRILKEINP